MSKAARAKRMGIPARVSIEREPSVRAARHFCVHCGGTERHRKDCPTVHERLVQAGFRLVDGKWIDMLA